jgi:hypothetical protein
MKGVAMKPAFLILPLAVTLCACAHDIMTAEDCKPAAASGRLGTSAALIGSGISPGYELIARDDRDPSRIVHAAATVDCARKNQAPRTYDLHKLGDRPSPPAVLLGSNSAGCSKAHA